MRTSASYLSGRTQKTESGWAPFFCARRAHITAWRLANGTMPHTADHTPRAADAPISQCYTARTIHVVYPQQAGRLQTGGLE
jgi:hypothetical protein